MAQSVVHEYSTVLWLKGIGVRLRLYMVILQRPAVKESVCCIETGCMSPMLCLRTCKRIKCSFILHLLKSSAFAKRCHYITVTECINVSQWRYVNRDMPGEVSHLLCMSSVPFDIWQRSKVSR